MDFVKLRIQEKKKKKTPNKFGAATAPPSPFWRHPNLQKSAELSPGRQINLPSAHLHKMVQNGTAAISYCTIPFSEPSFVPSLFSCSSGPRAGEVWTLLLPVTPSGLSLTNILWPHVNRRMCWAVCLCHTPIHPLTETSSKGFFFFFSSHSPCLDALGRLT